MRYVLVITIACGLALGAYFLNASFEPDSYRVEDTGGSSKEETIGKESSASSVGRSVKAESHHIASAGDNDASDSIDIQWRPRPSTALDWRDYPSTYDELRALAEAGDGHAAARLASLLWTCNQLPPPQTAAEIDAAVDEIRRTRLLPIYSRGTEKVVDKNNSLESLEDNIEEYEARARRCSKVTVEQRAELDHWLDRGMAMGSADILLDRLSSRFDREAYLQLLNDLWDSGDPIALFALAGRRYVDYLEGLDASGHVWAYAYELAITNLVRDFNGEHGIPAENSLVPHFEEALAERRRNMPAHEIHEAERIAGEIIENNDNCCLSWPEDLFKNE